MNSFILLPFTLWLYATPMPTNPPNLEMVGYQGNYTVFHSDVDNGIYLLKHDSFERVGDMKGWVRSVSDGYVLSSIDSTLLLQGQGKEQTLNLRGRPWGAAVSAKGGIFYVDRDFVLQSSTVRFSKPLKASDVLYLEEAKIRQASCAFFNAEKNYFGIIENGQITAIRRF